MISLMKITRLWFWTTAIGVSIIGAFQLSNLFQYKEIAYVAAPLALLTTLFLGLRFSYTERRNYVCYITMSLIALRLLVMLFHEKLFNGLACLDLVTFLAIYISSKFYFRTVESTMDDHWFAAEIQRHHRATEQ